MRSRRQAVKGGCVYNAALLYAERSGIATIAHVQLPFTRRASTPQRD